MTPQSQRLQRIAEAENICAAYLHEHGFTRGHYGGICHTLAYDTIKWMKHLGLTAEMRWIRAAPKEGLLYVTENSQLRGASCEWGFHCVVYYRRKVHDVWFGAPVPLAPIFP